MRASQHDTAVMQEKLDDQVAILREQMTTAEEATRDVTLTNIGVGWFRWLAGANGIPVYSVTVKEGDTAVTILQQDMSAIGSMDLARWL